MEYIVLNNRTAGGNNATLTISDWFVQRNHNKNYRSACITMPRLLFGALENVTCPHTTLTKIPKKHLTTLHHVQHAPKGDFAFSKFGKTMLDLTQLDAIASLPIPRNIHRPYKSYCGPGAVEYDAAPFVVHHYIGSSKQYGARSDLRRNTAEWTKRAYLTSRANCDATTWIDAFVNKVGGQARANYLLGA
jgi:hypothetical protein